MIHQVVQRLQADGAFLAGLLDAGQKFFARKFLAPSVAFENHEAFMFHFLVGGEAMGAAGAFAAAADGCAFTRSTRINDLIFLTAAFGTTHKTTANCGYMFVTYWILWVKFMLIRRKNVAAQVKMRNSHNYLAAFLQARLLKSFAFAPFAVNLCGSRLEKFQRKTFLFYGNSKRSSPRHGDQL
jgi:hypothetical protein